MGHDQQHLASSRADAAVREFGLPQADSSIHQFGTLLQVDTRMELGTSGGALVNLRGELIGVTTSLAALEGYERSVGFAIPIDEFTRRVIDTLCHGYEVEYGFLGLTLKTMLPDQLRRRYGVNFKQSSTVEVKTIIPNSPAAIAQVRQEDMILDIEGHPLLDQFDLMRYVALFGPEATVRLRIWRPSESGELTLAAKLGKWPVMEEDAIIATSRRYPAVARVDRRLSDRALQVHWVAVSIPRCRRRRFGRRLAARPRPPAWPRETSLPA